MTKLNENVIFYTNVKTTLLLGMFDYSSSEGIVSKWIRSMLYKQGKDIW